MIYNFKNNKGELEIFLFYIFRMNLAARAISRRTFASSRPVLGKVFELGDKSEINGILQGTNLSFLIFTRISSFNLEVPAKLRAHSRPNIWHPNTFSLSSCFCGIFKIVDRKFWH